jgi:hypothetical protein
MNKLIKNMIFVLFFLIILSYFSSASLNSILSDQGTGVKNKTTGVLLELGNITIEIWDSLESGNLIYNETFVNSIINGSWNLMLGENLSNPLPLEFNKLYYKDYNINNEDVDFTNLSGGVVERQLFYSSLGDVNVTDLADFSITKGKLESSINLSNATGYLYDNLVGTPVSSSDSPFTNDSTYTYVKSSYPSNVNFTGNLSLGSKIMFSFGSIINNIANELLKITGDLNVTGTITANSFSDGLTSINNGTINASILQIGGGFSNGGLSIQENGTIMTNGDILFSGEITVVNVSYMNVNGSVLPSINDTFDIGNSNARWNNANFSGTVDATTFVSGNTIITNGAIVINGQNVCLENGTNCLSFLSYNDTVWNISTSKYLINSSGILIINESELNNTINALNILINDSWKINASAQLALINSVTSANASWNQSHADTLYLGIIDQIYNETILINSMDNLSLSDVSNNVGNWSLDKSEYYNTTQVNDIADSINNSWKANASSQLSLINAITNDNVSWNESYADTLYLGIIDQRYNETTLINSMDNLSLSDVSNNIGNWSDDQIKYYNKTEIDTISDTINSSWKANATEQLTLITSMDNLSLSGVSSNLGNWSKDKSDYWNTSTNLNLTNNVSIYLTGNLSVDNFFGNINFSYIGNVPGYSLISNLVSLIGNWSLDKSKYYNTTQVNSIADTLNSSWKANASAQLTLINSMDNLSLNDVSNNIGNWSANASDYMRNDGDTATGNYTFNNTLLHIDATNDRIGIGTTNPTSKLHVKGGNITLENSTATENNYFKFGKGGYMYDDGTYVVIGHS